MEHPSCGSLVSTYDVKNTTGGSALDQTLVANAKTSLIVGLGGNDIIDLSAGGSQRLAYRAVDASDARGGNGSDTVKSFHVGNVLSDTQSDVIDLAGLLNGATKATLSNFVTTAQSGSNTLLYVDRDGAGTAYSPTLLLTLENVATTAQLLINNGQVIC